MTAARVQNDWFMGESIGIDHGYVPCGRILFDRDSGTVDNVLDGRDLPDVERLQAGGWLMTAGLVQRGLSPVARRR